MEKTNKQIMSSLFHYFMKQEKQVVCKCLAGVMIDFNRILNLDELDVDEKDDLINRITLNMKQLHDFIQNGHSIDFELKIMDSDDN